MPFLEISIYGAEDLPSVDGFLAGKSDPYVTCGVPGHGRHAIKTKTINNNVNPTWDHVEALQDWQVGEPIEFAVYDSNAVKSDKLLGKAFLQSEQFYPSGVEGTVSLEGTDIAKGTLRIQVLVVDAPTGIEGQVEAMPDTICVDVLSAKHLADTDGFMAGKSDPYVVVEVPGKKDMHFKTPVINNNLDPVWNHRTEIVGYMPGDPLEFTVYDKNAIQKDTFLGKFMLDSQSFYPNGAVGDVALQSKDGVEGQSTLEIAIHICAAASLPPLGSAAEAAVTQTAEITQAEAAAIVAEQPFDQIDTNHDGVITKQEFQNAVQAVATAPVATAGRVTCVTRSIVPGQVSYAAMPAAGAYTYAMPPVMATAAIASGTAPAPIKAYAASPVTYAAAPAVTYAAPPVAVAPKPAAVVQAKAPAFTYAPPATVYKAAPVTYSAPPVTSLPKAGAAPAVVMAAAAPTAVRPVAVASPVVVTSGSRIAIGAAPVGMAAAPMPSLRYGSMAPVGYAVSPQPAVAPSA